jgi:hypothetical protein
MVRRCESEGSLKDTHTKIFLKLPSALNCTRKMGELSNDAIIRSYERLQAMIPEDGEVNEEPINPTPPIEPIATQVEAPTSAIPMLLPHVPDDNLRPLLLAWYHAGYQTGRYQAL